MNQVVLVPDHFYNCPICGQKCHEAEEKHGVWQGALRLQGPCQVFLCYNPLPNDPLHYYCHLVEKSAPTRVAYQEFSLNLGNKHILVLNNFLTQKTSIKNSKDATPLELNFIIEPDFPYFNSLKKKIRTAITFS
jgi:hypothetical protein